MLPFASSFWPSPTRDELTVPAGLPNAGLPTGTAYAVGNPKQSVREDFGLMRFDYNANKNSYSENYVISDRDKAAPQTNTNFNQISRAESGAFDATDSHLLAQPAE